MPSLNNCSCVGYKSFTPGIDLTTLLIALFVEICIRDRHFSSITWTRHFFGIRHLSLIWKWIMGLLDGTKVNFIPLIDAQHIILLLIQLLIVYTREHLKYSWLNLCSLHAMQYCHRVPFWRRIMSYSPLYPIKCF